MEVKKSRNDLDSVRTADDEKYPSQWLPSALDDSGRWERVSQESIRDNGLQAGDFITSLTSGKTYLYTGEVALNASVYDERGEEGLPPTEEMKDGEFVVSRFKSED